MFAWEHELLKFADARLAANMKLVSDVTEAKVTSNFARILAEHVSNMYGHISRTVVAYSQRLQDILREGSTRTTRKRMRPSLSMNTPSKAPMNTPSKAPAASDRTSTHKSESLDTLSWGMSSAQGEPCRSKGRRHHGARNRKPSAT